MAALAPGGRITVEGVKEEVVRLRAVWRKRAPDEPEAILEEVLGPGGVEKLDRFDRVQLADVVQVARRCAGLSEAGRVLFAVSRKAKKSSNDADRLKKYLARFGLEWEGVSAGRRR